jgi:DNA repair protein RecO (recombination protein O)
VAQLGGVVADAVAPPGVPRLTAETIELLGALLTGDWGIADAAPTSTRGQASGVIAAYVQWHLERGLKSLNHLDRAVTAS